MAGTATLSWSASTGAISYLVEYKTTAGSWVTWGTTTGTTAVITGLLNGTTYDFKITSTCSTGTNHTVTSGNTNCIDPTWGSTPVTFIGTSASLNFINIPEVLSYSFYYKTTLGSWVLVNIIPLVLSSGITNTSYVISGLSTGTTYDFKIVCNCADSTSSPGSNVTTGTSSCPGVSSIGVVMS